MIVKVIMKLTSLSSNLNIAQILKNSIEMPLLQPSIKACLSGCIGMRVHVRVGVCVRLCDRQHTTISKQHEINICGLCQQ